MDPIIKLRRRKEEHEVRTIKLYFYGIICFLLTFILTTLLFLTIFITIDSIFLGSQLDKLNDTLGAGRSDHLVESMSSKIFTTIMDKMASNVSLNNRQSSSYNFLQNDRLDRCEFFQQQYPPVPVQYGLPSYGYYQTSSVPPMYQTAPQPVVGMQAQTYIPPTNPTPQVVYEGNGKPQTLDNVAAPTSGTNYGTSEKASSYGIAEDLQHITKNNNSPTATLTAAPLKTNDIGKQDNFAAAPVTYADSTQNPSDITRGTTGNTDSRLNELPIHDKYAIPALAPVSTASTGSSSPHTEMFPANTPVHSETHNNDFRSQQKSAIFVDSSKAQSREDSLHRPQSLYKVDNNLTSGYANDKFSYYDGDVKPNIIPLNDAPADLLNELQTIPDEVATTVVPNNDEARSAFILVGNTVQEAALVESNVITVGEEQKAKLHNGDLSFAKKQKEVEQDRAQENERETQRIAEELKLERIAKEQEVEAERIAKEKELALECAKQLEEAEFHAKHMEEKLAESKRLEKEREEEKQMEEARRAKEEAVEEEKRLEAERARIAEETEKKRIAQIEAEKKEEDDAAAISEARAKVLARRKQKQQRDGTASSSSSWPAFDDTTPRNSMDGNLGDTVKSMPSTNTLTARNSSDPVINIFNKTDVSNFQQFTTAAISLYNAFLAMLYSAIVSSL